MTAPDEAMRARLLKVARAKRYVEHEPTHRMYLAMACRLPAAELKLAITLCSLSRALAAASLCGGTLVASFASGAPSSSAGLATELTLLLATLAFACALPLDLLLIVCAQSKDERNVHMWVAEHVTLCGLPSRLAMVAFAGLLATLVLHAWARASAFAAVCVTMVVALLGRSLVRAANTLFASEAVYSRLEGSA